MTGQAASLLVGRLLGTVAGASLLTGVDVVLDYRPLAGSYTLSTEVGAFTLSGQGASLRAHRKLTAAACVLSGQPASLPVGRRLTVAAGAFTLTGRAAALLAARRLSAALGTFALTGHPATLTYSGASVVPLYQYRLTDRSACQSTSESGSAQLLVKS